MSSMDCKYSVLILGHSFVRRFHEFLNRGWDNLTEVDLNLCSVDISYLGIDGTTVDTLIALYLAKAEALRPGIITFEIGFNDLCALGSCPESVGSTIENLVSLLHHQCGAAFVIVCQVIHRKRFSAHCPHYNANVNTLNKYLRGS